jgi:hypothetical protein
MSSSEEEKVEIDIGQLAISHYTDVQPIVNKDKPPQLQIATTQANRRMSACISKSPSTPDLLASPQSPRDTPMSPMSMYRSKTLPRHFQGPPARPSELDDLPVDTDKIDPMRRWILGLVLGPATSKLIHEKSSNLHVNF